MNVAQLIFSTMLFLLSVVSFVFAYLQFREKGILLNNAYLYASAEERLQMDKKPYYRQSAMAFIGIGTLFFFIGLGTIMQWDWPGFVAIGLSLMLILYAIISSVLIEKNK